ncbi:zf-TFIIB domain-containing protein [Nocardioides sp. Bht2]|uniref:zf-TFIIB domain-containing protein n=1 Tax=Nocardioides sp. Bht2 TaxID=3392297 RepID=UPI0039B3AA9E
METLECPRCGVGMEERRLGRSAVRRCPDGHGVFLERLALGDLIDAENDWHRSAEGFHTAPLPRITADMAAPPPAPVRAPAWVATLFD